MKDPKTANDFILAIIEECVKSELGKAQCAYVLATSEWETAYRFQPIEEYGKGKGKTYGKTDPATGKAYYGRGLVQLTWKNNYEKYNEILGLKETKDDLVRNPDIALRPWVSIFILVHGMKNGTFTGKRIGQFVSTDGKNIDFIGARKVINGTDKAKEIAELANKWLKGNLLTAYYP